MVVTAIDLTHGRGRPASLSTMRATQNSNQGHATAPAHLVILLAGLTTAVAACGGGRETAILRAQPGDTLVRSGQQGVVLERAFRPGIPNGLYAGVIRVVEPGRVERQLEVNGVCSMPGLQAEGWPGYDNLYGRRLPDGARWQVLFHFDGRVETNTATTDLNWLGELRDNLCRRGRFSDRGKDGDKP